MYIKQALFDDIGLFDDENFPRGYGEENDFCMRAFHADWAPMLSRPRVPGLVSLVIPTFNRVGLIEKFLRSIIVLTERRSKAQTALLFGQLGSPGIAVHSHLTR